MRIRIGPSAISPVYVVTRGVYRGIASPRELALARALGAEMRANERRRRSALDMVEAAARTRGRTAALGLLSAFARGQR